MGKSLRHIVRRSSHVSPWQPLDDEPAAQPASRFGARLTMVSTWKRQIRDGAGDIGKRKDLREGTAWMGHVTKSASDNGEAGSFTCHDFFSPLCHVARRDPNTLDFIRIPPAVVFGSPWPVVCWVSRPTETA